MLALGSAPAQASDDAGPMGLFSEAGYVQGEYEMRIASMLDGTSRVSHHVKTGDEVYEIVLGEGVESPEYNSFVRVPGELAFDGRWVADELIVLSPPPEPLIDAEPRPARRVGTVLVFWEGGGLPNAQANNSMFTADDSTNVYYGENSYGIETMAGKVFGPYQIDNPGGCNTNQIVNLADQAMIERGHDPSDYRQMMYHFPGGLGCGFAGLASVGSPDNPARNSWYSGSFGCVVRNQELGHNYGMGHSHAYNCPPEPEGMDHNPYSECSHIEYGHPYDPMGGGCGHMNVVQKTFMGWIDECNVVTATSSGVFNLLPTEWSCNGTQALVFPASDGRYYHLEYRNGDGEFAIGSGVLVNIAPQVGGGGPTGYVLDELGENNNGYLHEGDTFTDPGTLEIPGEGKEPGVPAQPSSGSFTILEEHDTHVVIQVDLADGGDGAPPTCRGGGSPMDEAGAIGSLECTGVPYPADETPPEVRITYPENGEVFEPGADFTIVADATDDRQVIEVELYLNGEPFSVLTQPPWEWPAAGIPEGEYEFGVVARDARSWTPSDAVAISVTSQDDPGDGTGSADETAGEDDSLPGESGDATGGDTDDGTTTEETAGQTEPGGCGCNQPGNAGGYGFGLMVLAIAWMRRRND